MIRVPAIIVFACALLLGCHKDEKDPGETEATSKRGPGAPNLPTQSAEELKTVLAKIDDQVITLAEFQERINRQSPYIRARYTSL
ncbi:MAG: hypothetical protein ABI867_28990, partial [Kofleriaceae bacterium]